MPVPSLRTPGVLFPPGQVVVTPGALVLFAEARVNPVDLLRRHLCGDWGDLDADDKAANTAAVPDGSRILSAYRLGCGAKVWVITEADRSVTTFLLPEEY